MSQEHVMPEKRQRTSQKPARKKSAASPPNKGKASHDVPYPPALVDFMMQHWKPATQKPPAKVRHARELAARRKRLSEAFPGETLVIPTGHEVVRANDTHYRFRPGTAFYYFTGNLEPDCVLLLLPKRGGGHEQVLLVEP